MGLDSFQDEDSLTMFLSPWLLPDLLNSSITFVFIKK